MFAPIRWRLVGWNLLVLSLILAALGTATYVSMSRALLAEVDGTLAARAQEAAANLHEAAEGGLLLGSLGYRGGLFYILVGPDGTVLADPQSSGLRSGSVLAPSADGSARYDNVTLGNEPARLYVQPIVDRSQAVVGALVVGQTLASQQSALRGLLVALAAGGIGGVVLAVAGAWFLAGRSLVPIERAFRRQQEFVADAAHELRTPLTVLRSATDLLDRHRAEPLEANADLLDDVRQEIARLERLVGDLLTLARSDVGELDLAIGTLDLAVLAADVARRAAPLASERGIALDTEVAGPLPADGDPDRLQQVLLILVDNALKHTPRGGSVKVVARRQGGDALLQVVDTGEGIPPEHLPRVFDRFYRAERARRRSEGSTGLGLAIARSMVEAHGGQLALSSAVGIGTTATVRLRLMNRPAPWP